ncbi:MAG: response regulator [Spirochaetales bacterium]|nr:response regulator [Spirochaetales bacterium]
MSCKILVVDNSTALTNPWKGTLSQRYTIYEVMGGFEAVSRLRSDSFDLVIVNISNKHIKGVDAVNRIREKNDNIPIIVISDPKDALALKQAKAYGIQQALPVPVDEDLLFLVISRLVPKASLQAEENRQEKQAAEAAGQLKRNKNYEDVESQYYEGLNAIGANQIDKAIEIFSSIIKISSIKTERWRHYIEETYFQLGLCYSRKNEFEKSIKLYKEFVTRAPHHKNIKAALLYIGQSYQKLKVLPKAAFYYKKVMSLKPFDSFSSQATKLFKKIEKLC